MNMYTIKSYWEVHRSRDNGKFWSNLTYGMDLPKDAAYDFAEKENINHPSDWLRVVRVEEVVERGYNCYGHSKDKPKMSTKPIKPIKILRDPIDIKKFNKICNESLGGLQMFK